MGDHANTEYDEVRKFLSSETCEACGHQFEAHLPNGRCPDGPANDYLYVAAFRVSPSAEGYDPHAVHKAIIEGLTSAGQAPIPGLVMVKEYDPNPATACVPDRRPPAVMASDHTALCQLGATFEEANGLIPVVTEKHNPDGEERG